VPANAAAASGARTKPDHAGSRPRCGGVAQRAAGSQLDRPRSRRAESPALPHRPRRTDHRPGRDGVRPARRALPEAESAGQSRRGDRCRSDGRRHSPDSGGAWRPADPRSACTARDSCGRGALRLARDARYAVRGVRLPAAVPGRGVIGREGHSLRRRQRGNPARAPAGRPARLRLPPGGDARRRPGHAGAADLGHSCARRP
jgi:hypothetical protein